MALRRSDSRRRRLVVDPSQTASQADEQGAPALSSEKTSGSTQKDIRAYSFGADRRNVNKTTDLFPKRIVPYMLVVLVLLVCLGMINYCAIQAYQWRAHIGDPGVSSLSVSGIGSLGSWFTSFLLIVSSLASLQIFALRKHRCDDYRGTYRLWIWMSGVLLLASLCCIVNLASIARYAFESLTQISFLEKPWLAPTIVISLLTILAARVVFEVRRSRGSMAWVSTAWLGLAAAGLLHLPSVGESLPLEFNSRSVAGNCVLFGTASLLMAHLTYVRFIFLRAHGLIKLVAKKKVTKKKVAQTKTKSKPKPKAKSSSKSNSSKTSTTTKKKKAAKPAEEVDEQSQIAAADSSEKKKAAKKKAKRTKVKVAPETKDTTEVAGKTESKKTPRLSLKEMAAASRAKAKAQSNRVSKAAEEEEGDSEGIIKMSKAQRRKQRKDSRKNRKRAA